MTQHNRQDQVRLVEFAATRIAVLEHHGDPQRIGDSIRRFIAWRRQHRLSPTVSATFNILYNDPYDVTPEDYRIDLCAATDLDIDTDDSGIIFKTLPAGRCAVLRHTGSDDTLGDSIRFLYTQWLPQSGEEPRDYPAFLQRLTFFPDVAEHEAVTDIFLPIEG